MTGRRLRLEGVLLLAFGVLIAFPFEHRDGVAAPKFGAWSAPINIGSADNTEFAEFAAHISKDGQSLYFASTRPAAYGSFGGEDLWVSQRASTSAPWGLPMNLGQVINTAANERSPTLSRDGHYLFFAADRPGGFGALDIWVSWRPNSHDDFGWEAPTNLGASVNTASTDAGPSFFENDDVGMPQLYIASNRPGGPGGLDIYVTTLAAGLFQPPTAVPGLNTAQTDLTPAIRFDGLEIVVASNRPGGVGSQDLWASTRPTIDDAWSLPVNLGPTVNSTATDNFPSLSGDRQSLFFNSDRGGGFGASDIYVSSRER
jgi:Tol biopolymer transport system component